MLHLQWTGRLPDDCGLALPMTRALFVVLLVVAAAQVWVGVTVLEYSFFRAILPIMLGMFLGAVLHRVLRSQYYR